MAYRYETTVRMYDTDTAQILFFGNQFRFINDALEELLNTIDLNMHKLFNEMDYGFVFVHAESDYLAPLTVGDTIAIDVAVSHIGTSSFSFHFDITNTKTNILSGTAKTVHVTIDTKSRKKISIPQDLKEKLQAYLNS